VAVVLRFDLENSAQVAKFLSLYLLFAIGFKGCVALVENAAEVFSLVMLGAALARSSISREHLGLLPRGLQLSWL